MSRVRIPSLAPIFFDAESGISPRSGSSVANYANPIIRIIVSIHPVIFPMSCVAWQSGNRDVIRVIHLLSSNLDRGVGMVANQGPPEVVSQRRVVPVFVIFGIFSNAPVPHHVAFFDGRDGGAVVMIGHFLCGQHTVVKSHLVNSTFEEGSAKAIAWCSDGQWIGIESIGKCAGDDVAADQFSVKVASHLNSSVELTKSADEVMKHASTRHWRGDDFERVAVNGGIIEIKIQVIRQEDAVIAARPTSFINQTAEAKDAGAFEPHLHRKLVWEMQGWTVKNSHVIVHAVQTKSGATIHAVDESAVECAVVVSDRVLHVILSSPQSNEPAHFGIMRQGFLCAEHAIVESHLINRSMEVRAVGGTVPIDADREWIRIECIRQIAGSCICPHQKTIHVGLQFDMARVQLLKGADEMMPKTNARNG